MVSRRSYTYADEGFNAFMQRSISSDYNVRTLSDIAKNNPQPNINFDQQQTSGTIGDRIIVGKRILIDGIKARIDIKAQNEVDVGTRIGELDD